MKLTTKELEYVKNVLLAKRSYRYTSIPCLATVWEPWMETFLQKITDELEV
jgi:hypothetical protein